MGSISNTNNLTCTTFELYGVLSGTQNSVEDMQQKVCPTFPAEDEAKVHPINHQCDFA